MKIRGQEPTFPLYSPKSGFDNALGKSLIPSHSRFSLYSSWPAAATEMRTKVSLAMQSQIFFKLDALPAATLPISGLGDQLRICWLVYPEARLLK